MSLFFVLHAGYLLDKHWLYLCKVTFVFGLSEKMEDTKIKRLFVKRIYFNVFLIFLISSDCASVYCWKGNKQNQNSHCIQIQIVLTQELEPVFERLLEQRSERFSKEVPAWSRESTNAEKLQARITFDIFLSKWLSSIKKNSGILLSGCNQDFQGKKKSGNLKLLVPVSPLWCGGNLRMSGNDVKWLETILYKLYWLTNIILYL